MENATKALLIAAAVLIAIILISMGVYVVSLGQNTLNKVNIDEMAVKEHNSRFSKYVGNNVRGSRVKQLINDVVTYNLTAEDDSLKVSVVTGTESGTASGVAQDSISVIEESSIGSGSSYKVECPLDPATGLISTITVTKIENKK